MDTSEEILELLRENARYSIDDLARLTDADPEEVEDTIEHLEDSGVIRGYQAVVDFEETDRERVHAIVELNVTLDRETSYSDIADRIVKFPQVRELRLVSGDYDFDMEVEGDSMREVSHFISDKIAPIPEITQTVTHYLMDSYKKQGIVMGDGDDDDRLSISP